MTLVVALLAWSLLSVLGSPLILARGSWYARRPRTALALWGVAFAGGLLAAAGTLVVTLLVAAHAAGWGGARTGGVGATAVLVVGGWTSLAALGALGSLVATRAEPIGAAHRAAQVQLMLLAAGATRRSRAGGATVLHVESDLPLAMSLPGRERTIVVTSRVEAELTPGQVRAVVEHERAHLRQRHGRIAQLARLNASCLPRLAGARELERVTHLLVELIADDTAARVVGTDVTAGALARLGVVAGDESMALRSARLLARPPHRSVRGRRTAAARTRA